MAHLLQKAHEAAYRAMTWPGVHLVATVARAESALSLDLKPKMNWAAPWINPWRIYSVLALRYHASVKFEGHPLYHRVQSNLSLSHSKAGSSQTEPKGTMVQHA